MVVIGCARASPGPEQSPHRSTRTSSERRWFHAAPAAWPGVLKEMKLADAPTLCSRDQPVAEIVPNTQPIAFK